MDDFVGVGGYYGLCVDVVFCVVLGDGCVWFYVVWWLCVDGVVVDCVDG